MKAVLTSVVAIAIALSISACGKQEEEKSKAEEPKLPATPHQEQSLQTTPESVTESKAPMEGGETKEGSPISPLQEEVEEDIQKEPPMP